MNIGRMQFIWWPPVRLESERCECSRDGDVVWRVYLRGPALSVATSDAPYRIFDWSVTVGWLEVRRFAATLGIEK